MSPEINKFKKKVNLEAIIRSLLLGLCIGLIAGGAPALYLKMQKQTIQLLYFILIAVGVFALVFLVTYLITKPSEIKVAKRIDKELNLQEKATTMVVYKDNTDPIYKVQRESTNEILSNISIKQLSFKISKILLAICVVSIGVFVTSICYPTYVTPIEEEPVIDTTDFQEAVIRQLIRDIRADLLLKTDAKVSYITSLTALDEQISKAMVSSKRQQFVRECINDCYSSAENMIYIDDIAEFIHSLELSDEVYPVDAFMISCTEVLSLKKCDQVGFIESLEKLQKDMETSLTDCKNIIKYYRMFLGTKLKNATELDQTNPVVLELIKLSDELSALNIGGNFIDQIDVVFEQIIAEFNTVLIEDCRVAYWAKEIDNRLSIAFLGKTPSSQAPDSGVNNTPPSDDTLTKEEQELNGEYLRPSEQEVYSSILGQYEKYYENIGSYEQTIREQFASGMISEELFNVFEKYFSTLIETNKGE